MSAKLVKVVEEKGVKTLASGSVLHKYVADLLVDGAEVKAAKVAVWGNAENDAFRAGQEMSCRVKTDDYGTEYNLSSAAKAGAAGGAKGGGFGARPPRYEDSKDGFLGKQRSIMFQNALSNAVSALGPLAADKGGETAIELARAFFRAGVKEVGLD